jgi:hypothetical protein
MPAPLIAALADLPHDFQHAVRLGLAGLPNGAIHKHAVDQFDLFISNDRHFKDPKALFQNSFDPS